MDMKDITGYEGLYKISEDGYVFSVRRNKIMKPSVDGWKYRQIYLSKSGITTRFSLHRLIAKYFIPNPENKPNINHIDGDKGNNCISNLEWCTQSENIRHAFDNGLCKGLKGIDHPKNKLSELDVIEIRRISNLGLKQSIIANIFNVNQGTIYGIVNRLIWKHI